MRNKGNVLTGRTALVTGGARNIGLAVAKALASDGADVAVVDICRDLETIPYSMSDRRTLEKAVSEISNHGVRSLGLTCDVRAEDQVKTSIERVIREFGQLDILVSNAATGGFRPLLNSTEKNFRATFGTNVLALLYLVQAAVPLLEQSAGRAKVIALSSHGSDTALPWYG